jgi:hypothetical protein
VIVLLSLLILAAMIVSDIAARSFEGIQSFGVMTVILVAATLVTGLMRRLEPAVEREPETPSGFAGHTIARVEYHGARPVIVLDDGRRLLLDPGAKLD